jgi:hypothetical protein
VAIADEDFDFNVQCFLAGVQFYDQTSDAPKTYSKAMKAPDAASWSAAVESELSAMDCLQVWEVIDIPPGAELLKTVWIFWKKFDENGALSKYKARLCPAGNFQTKGVNYTKTYAPMGCPTALRALLSLGVNEGYSIHQMDVKNAFCNGKLDKTIFLRPLAGLPIPKGKFLHLLKSIYGLKQVLRVWHHELLEFFKSIKFSASDADPCLFVSDIPSWKCWVHVYVDDMVIVSKDVDRFKKLVMAKYLMEDLGPLKHLLGMRIEKSGSSIRLLQDNYVNKILVSYGMQDAWTVPTPCMVPNTRLLPATDNEHQAFLQLGVNFCRAIGLLNYLVVLTRPEISFAMSQLSQFLERPGTTHWNACIHILCYLCGTPLRGLNLGNSITPLKIYTDTDYPNDEEDLCSYFGYLVLMGNSLISWKAKKEQSVSLSTTKAEYVGLYEGGQEEAWLRKLFKSLDISIPTTIPIMCDNQAAIKLSKNAGFSDRTKHF